MASALERLNESQSWRAQLTSSVVDASAIYNSIPDTTKMASGAVPDTSKMIANSVPKVTEMTTAFTGLDVATRSPVYGGTFRPSPAPLDSEATLPSPTKALPQELGERFAQRLTRKHRQEAKGLLVALGLDLELEHLESIERRLLDGRRPDRLQAALSASLLLKGVANKLYPPSGDEEAWVCRFGHLYKLGPEHVKNRLHAFAHPYLEGRSTQEHKLFIAELDLVSDWGGAGHHVGFTETQSSEAFCALLKVLATVARARRNPL